MKMLRSRQLAEEMTSVVAEDNVARLLTISWQGLIDE